MFRNLFVISAVALGMCMTVANTAQAQPNLKVLVGKGVGGKNLGFGINVNLGGPGGMAYCGTPTYCPPTYCPPVQSCYIVQYCNPCWHYKTFHCYQSACQYLNYKKSCGCQAYIQCYGGCWRVYYQVCNWQTYQVCNSYGYAQQIYGQLQGQGYSVKILPKH